VRHLRGKIGGELQETIETEPGGLDSPVADGKE
jgi:hypothetical protein